MLTNKKVFIRRKSCNGIISFQLGCIIVILLFLSSITTIPVIISNSNNQQRNTFAEEPLESIRINSNLDFITLGFEGNGTKENPYKIEYLNIETSNDYGIFITDTTSFFVIQNVYVDASIYGIHIRDIAEGTAIIRDNFCNYNNNPIWTSYGIIIKNSDQVTISNNTFKGNDIGVSISNSVSFSVINNTCTSNDLTGLYFSETSDGIIANNSCVGDYREGIRIANKATNITLENNACSSCGIDITLDSLDDYRSLFISNNTVNNKPFRFEIDLNNTNISDASGEIILVNCFNITISNQEMSGISKAISVVNCSQCAVINNTCSYIRDTAIELLYSPMTIVEKNNCFKNSIYGIAVIESSTCSITNNSFEENRYGLFVGSSDECLITNNSFERNSYGLYIYYSDESSIICNSFEENNYGLRVCDCNSSKMLQNSIDISYFSGISLMNTEHTQIANNLVNISSDTGISLYLCSFSVISDNNISNCERAGLYLSHINNVSIFGNSISNNEDSGFFLRSAVSVNISNNEIIYCKNGIEAYRSYNISIIYNLFENNSYYGVSLEYSHNNSIHHNRFINNNLGGSSQAYDNEIDNLWFDSLAEEGNYWSVWNGRERYKIDGEKVYDKFPLNSTLFPVKINYSWLIMEIIVGSVIISFVTWVVYNRIKRNMKKQHFRRKNRTLKQEIDSKPSSMDKRMKEKDRDAKVQLDKKML